MDQDAEHEPSSTSTSRSAGRHRLPIPEQMGRTTVTTASSSTYAPPFPQNTTSTDQTITNATNQATQAEKSESTPDVPSKDKPIVTVVEITEADKNQLKECAIIVLIGPTGTGKSNFIEKIASVSNTGQKITGIAKAKLDAGTIEVAAYRMDHQNLNIWTRKPVVFVDTPGLSDRRKSEMQVLSQIQRWMKKYGVKNVDRLLYLDRISDNRMPRSKAKSLEIFKALCGKEAANRTLVITTMWDLMWNDRLKAHAAHRYDLLERNHWQDFIAQGCKIDKFDNTVESAWKNLRRLGKPATDDVPEQKPFAFEKGERMRDTEMGQKAFLVLQERYENLDISLQVVQADLKHSDEVQNPELKEVLLKQHHEIAQDLKLVSDELQGYNPDYQKFRDEVYEQLDRPGSPESWTTAGSAGGKKPTTFKAKLEGWLTKLKFFSSGKSPPPSQPASRVATPYFPPATLPNIHEFVIPEEPGSSSVVRGVAIQE